MHRFKTWWLLCVAAIVGKLLWASLSSETLFAVMQEDGFVESLTLGFYAAAFGTVAIAPGRGSRHWTSSRLALLIVILGLTAREWDAHIRLTGSSVLRVSYYLNGPLSVEKLWALSAVALFAASLLCLVGHYTRVLRQRVRGNDAIRSAVIAFIATALIAKVLDRAVNILAQDFEFVISVTFAMLMLSIEETLELALPLIVVAAVWQHARTVSPGVSRKQPLGSTGQSG